VRGGFRPGSAIALVLAIGMVAAALGYLSRGSNTEPEAVGHEKVLARAPEVPRLPAFEVASGWARLPTPPQAARTPDSGGAEFTTEGDVAEPEPSYEATEPEPSYEPTEVYEPGPVKEPGPAGGERCYGISVGPTC
jgi:hypothetical protein